MRVSAWTVCGTTLESDPHHIPDAGLADADYGQDHRIMAMARLRCIK